MDKKEIKALLNNTNNPIILEVGANNGSDTCEFINEFKDLEIYCFEPDDRAYDIFVSHIKYDKCKIFKIALSDVDGETDFYISTSNQRNPGTPREVGNNWDKSGSIKKPTGHLTAHPWCKFDETKKIKTLTLDTWMLTQNIDHIDFIWADVQGAEGNLIKGGIQTLNNKTKYFYTEFSNVEMYEDDASLEKIMDLLPNFELIKVFDYDVLLRNKNV